ncbi:hypothetical protein CEQ21_04165 [Niallia circulans]|uniref:Antigen I/II N-terminal domain-containing protein n=1 Tax=Niallia circulans TaxID=1397 RepID=A0A553ST13_NIACI|nr:hypothetical protein [Niallia circulans]TRZ40143.1 hypothetical protein CEQ21_04165 [Niallia circulans]
MKKWSYSLLLAMAMFALAACGADKEASKASNDEKETAESEELAVDKGLLNVEITMPASFVEGQDIESTIKEAEAEGIKVTKNEDGSLTYKMSKSEHKQMMKGLKKNAEDSLEEIKTDGTFPSVKDIEHNKSFSKFTMTVDKAAYENSMDAWSVIGIGITGMMYNLFNGEDMDKMKINIDIKDEATGEVFDTTVYPDALEEADKSLTTEE